MTIPDARPAPAGGSTASADAASLGLPTGHALSRPGLAQVDEMLALVHASDVVAVGFPDFTTDDVREWLEAPFTTPQRDGWLVRDPHGALVSWAFVESEYGERSEDGGVYLHPESDPAIARPLVDLVVARCAERAAEAGRDSHELLFWCTNEPLLAATVAAAGARKAKTFARMRRDLDGGEGRLPVPAGIELDAVDVDDEGQLREFHAVYVEAFAGHFGFVPSTYEAWLAHVQAAPQPCYDQWLVAREHGRVVGVSQAADMSSEGGGWTRNLAVLASHRGRGIARLLLDRAFAASAARGFTWHGLGVDTQNETGAYRLYESVGMRVQFESDAWELTVPAGSAGSAGSAASTP